MPPDSVAAKIFKQFTEALQNVEPRGTNTTLLTINGAHMIPSRFYELVEKITKKQKILQQSPQVQASKEETRSNLV